MNEMKMFFKSPLFFFIYFFSILFSYHLDDNKSLKPSFHIPVLEKNVDFSNEIFSKINASTDEIIYFEVLQEDFEDDAHGWSLSSGWEITDQSSHSGSRSLLSQNNESNKNGKHILISRPYSLTDSDYALGDGETMHFGFWLNADIPDSDGDGDGVLEDYYTISLQDMSSFAWHVSSFNMDEG